MSAEKCDLVENLIAGPASDTAGKDLKDHIRHCSQCRESELLASWLKQYQQQALKNVLKKKKFPDADQIWDQAYSFAAEPDKNLINKALRPLKIPVFASYLLAIVIPFYLLVFDTAKISSLLASIPGGRLLSSVFSNLFGSSSGSAFLILPAVMGLVPIIVFWILSGSGSRLRNQAQGQQ